MTAPREIIAYTIPGTSAELCFGLADAIIGRLTASGHHILSDADLAARDDAVLAELERAKKLLANSLREFSPISEHNHMRDVIAFLDGDRP